jgi:hypothetical protein
MGTRRFAAIAFAAVFAASVAAGCAQGTGGSAQPGGSVPPTASDNPTPGGSLPPSWRATPAPPDKSFPAGEQTLTGRVVQGVEPGCLVMNTPEGTYLLLGGSKQVIQAGAWITVRGKANPKLMTTCQQGVPFEVMEARPA